MPCNDATKRRKSGDRPRRLTVLLTLVTSTTILAIAIAQPWEAEYLYSRGSVPCTSLGSYSNPLLHDCRPFSRTHAEQTPCNLRHIIWAILTCNPARVSWHGSLSHTPYWGSFVVNPHFVRPRNSYRFMPENRAQCQEAAASLGTHRANGPFASSDPRIKSLNLR
jgi:hypothetical protein